MAHYTIQFLLVFCWVEEPPNTVGVAANWVLCDGATNVDGVVALADPNAGTADPNTPPEAVGAALLAVPKEGVEAAWGTDAPNARVPGPVGPFPNAGTDPVLPNGVEFCVEPNLKSDAPEMVVVGTNVDECWPNEPKALPPEAAGFSTLVSKK